MNQTPPHYPTKQSVHLSIDSQLLAEAKQLKINLLVVFESALTAEVKARRSARWLEENQKGLEALNDFVDEHGMFIHKGRVW